jgi:hypothetical protein
MVFFCQPSDPIRLLKCGSLFINAFRGGKLVNVPHSFVESYCRKNHQTGMRESTVMEQDLQNGG